MIYTHKLSNGTEINIDLSIESKKTQEHFYNFIKSEIFPLIKNDKNLSNINLDIPLNYLLNEHKWEIFLNSDLSSNVQIQNEMVNKLSNF